ncbi:MAG: hypothetical protein P8106_04160 [Gammaproteobacteria bacterium]
MIGYLIGSAGHDVVEHEPLAPDARQQVAAPPPAPPPQATPAPPARSPPAPASRSPPSHWSSEISRNGGRRALAPQPPTYQFRPLERQRGAPQRYSAPAQEPAAPWGDRYAPSQPYAVPQPFGQPAQEPPIQRWDDRYAPGPALAAPRPYPDYERFRPLGDRRQAQPQQADPYRAPLPGYASPPYAYDPRFPPVR